MGEATLVIRDAREGALLVERFDSSDLRLTAAFWVHDAGLNVWRLVLAAPRHIAPSPRAAYALIQETINELDLSLALDRVTFIADSDPLVGMIKEFAAISSNDVVEIPLAGADIAGVPVDTAYAYRVESIRFEKDILTALRRVQPDGTVLRRAENELPNGGFNFDLAINKGFRMVLVIAKALPRKINSKDVQRIVAGYEERAGRSEYVAVMIISKTGFASGTSLIPSPKGVRLMEVMLVEWAGVQDDAELRTRLTQFLDAPPHSQF
jgi:hypothetical protein